MSDIKAVIWDFDGVFYPLTDAVKKCFNKVNLLAFAKALPELSFKKVEDLFQSSCKECGDPYSGFKDAFEAKGMDKWQFKHSVAVEFNKSVYSAVTKKAPHITNINENIVNKFSLLATTGIRQAIASHSYREPWIKPLLKDMGRDSFFADKDIFGIEELYFQKKHMSANAISIVMEKLAVKPEEVIYVEDSKANIVAAKKGFPSLTTIFVREEYDNRNGSKYIDMVAKNQQEALDKILQIKSTSSQKLSL